MGWGREIAERAVHRAGWTYVAIGLSFVLGGLSYQAKQWHWIELPGRWVFWHAYLAGAIFAVGVAYALVRGAQEGAADMRYFHPMILPPLLLPYFAIWLYYESVPYADAWVGLKTAGSGLLTVWTGLYAARVRLPDTGAFRKPSL